MKKLLRGAVAAASLSVLASVAFAQFGGPFTGPATRHFLGPSVGEVWLPSGVIGPYGFNDQTGTTYTVVATDMGKLVTMSNASAVAVAMPVATTVGFEASKCFNLFNLGAGTVTVTPTTSTINGGATKTYAQNVGGRICSDGTNYRSF